MDRIGLDGSDFSGYLFRGIHVWMRDVGWERRPLFWSGIAGKDRIGLLLRVPWGARIASTRRNKHNDDSVHSTIRTGHGRRVPLDIFHTLIFYVLHHTLIYVVGKKKTKKKTHSNKKNAC